MTDQSKKAESDHSGRVQSPLLPFAEQELLSVRLLPAEFSRAAGVSKQTVSRWIKKNIVTLGADGRLDPKIAMRQILKNSDPGRVRARLVRMAYADLADLREQANRAGDLESQLADTISRMEYFENYAAELDLAFDRAVDVLVGGIAAIRAAQDPEALRKVFGGLLDAALLRAADERALRGVCDADFTFHEPKR